MPEQQLEFDLVSPFLMGPSLQEEQMLNEAAALLAESKEKIRFKKMVAEMQYQDLLIDARPTNELEELRLIIGPEAWKKSSRTWKRRLKQNVIAFRKVLIVLRHIQQKEKSK